MVMAIAVIVGAMSASAQELASRKHGTVREQMEQSALFQNNTHYDEVCELLEYAKSFIGTRYRSGSSSPNGFDCSVFTFLSAKLTSHTFELAGTVAVAIAAG